MNWLQALHGHRRIERLKDNTQISFFFQQQTLDIPSAAAAEDAICSVIV